MARFRTTEIEEEYTETETIQERVPDDSAPDGFRLVERDIDVTKTRRVQVDIPFTAEEEAQADKDAKEQETAAQRLGRLQTFGEGLRQKAVAAARKRKAGQAWTQGDRDDILAFVLARELLEDMAP